jgi:RNA recognition motif-containing protein
MSNSQQDRRVYVGNLSYDVKALDLKEFMTQAGEVVSADVLQLPNGRSKGCGIVEYATAEDAQNAVQTLSNQTLMGRLVFVREDREASRAPFRAGGAAPPPPPTFGAPPAGAAVPGTQLFVTNLPYQVGWQDLKDLFRSAGNVIRADIHTSYDGRPRGSGTVIFETPEAAQSAISQFSGYEWHGRPIEVREDRMAGGGGRSFRASGAPRAAGAGGAGGVGGGVGGAGGFAPAPTNDFTDGARGNGEPSDTIYCGNLPWSTTNEDLVELFQTVGAVVRAEIQYLSNGRSNGAGVVQFDATATAQLAIGKFSGYNYGNRDLNLSFVTYRN